MSEYQKLEAAAEQLRRSERGRRALENISKFFRDGGTGLDDSNKLAALALFMAALHNPWDLPANLTQRERPRER